MWGISMCLLVGYCRVVKKVLKKVRDKFGRYNIGLLSLHPLSETNGSF